MQPSAYLEDLFLLPLHLRGNSSEAQSSVPGTRGGGVTGRTPVGATQPEEAAVLVSASWRYTSRLTGSTGRDSNGRAKRATWLPIHLERGVGAVGDSK